MASVKRTKAKPMIELPPEDVPFDQVMRQLLAAPPPHEPRASKLHKKATLRRVPARKKRGTRTK